MLLAAQVIDIHIAKDRKGLELLITRSNVNTPSPLVSEGSECVYFIIQIL